MLTLSHIRKDYGKFTAVEDINLELENGLYAMLAPNGAGKTTLIKMITILLYPTSGEILYDGMDIYKMGETYRDVIGYLPQHFGYYKNNTPTQYLDYLAALKGISKEAAREKIPELLELVGLSDVFNKKPKKLSGRKNACAVGRYRRFHHENQQYDPETGGCGKHFTGQSGQKF